MSQSKNLQQDRVGEILRIFLITLHSQSNVAGCILELGQGNRIEWGKMAGGGPDRGQGLGWRARGSTVGACS